MSRKTKRNRGRGVPAEAPRGRARVRAGVVALCACLLAGAAVGGSRSDAVRRAVGLRPLLAPAAQSQGGLPLAKEYVYAGGRLVATEEPTPTPAPTPAGPPPTNLVATLSAVSGAAATVHVSWTPPSGNVTGYVVERAGASGQFAPVGQPVVAPDTSFSDAGASEGAAYLYRVKAVYAGGASPYSNSDLATAVAFTNDPIIGAADPQNRPATVIKAEHLVELRRAVGAVRALAGGLAPASWSYPDPVSSPPSQRRPVYLEDVQELRDRLGEALPALGLSAPSYVDPTLVRRVTKVKKEHFQQLRDAVK